MNTLEILVETPLVDSEKQKEYCQWVGDKMVEGANFFLEHKVMKADPQIGDHWIH